LTAKKSSNGASAKKAPPASLGVPPLDATQKALIAKLTGAREAWQVSGPYDPLHNMPPYEVRFAKGVSLQRATPHEAHSEWAPPENRPNPVDVVLAGNEGRQPQYVPLRMGRMAASPFAFLRGAAAVMAWDLSHTPISGPQVMIDGDAHINNFGLYGTPQRDVVVDLNDFDEATPGPWEWDLKRLVASVNVAGRENGFNAKERRRSVRKAVSGYCFNMDRLSKMGVLEVWSLPGRVDVRPTMIKVPDTAWAIIRKTVAKARQSTNTSLLTKVSSRRSDGGWRFREDPPILTHIDAATQSRVIAGLSEYAESLSAAYRSMLRRYTVVDVAHRVVGVGSVGTRAYLALCFGNGDNDPLFLQVKEAITPVHAAYLPEFDWRKEHLHQGRRIIEMQRLLQTMGDPMLGSTTVDGRHFFVRQMKNMKASMPVSLMTGEPFDFWAFACGALLARAHARAGNAAHIAGYCQGAASLERALSEFAELYGDQTERDHAELVKAIASGRVKAAVENDGQ